MYFFFVCGFVVLWFFWCDCFVCILHLFFSVFFFWTVETCSYGVCVFCCVCGCDLLVFFFCFLRQLKLLQKTNVSAARCAIVWIAGEYREHIQQYAPDALRILAKTFTRESGDVKLQILNLATKIHLTQPEKVTKIFKYVLDLCKYDEDYDLRDRKYHKIHSFFVFLVAFCVCLCIYLCVCFVCWNLYRCVKNGI